MKVTYSEILKNRLQGHFVGQWLMLSCAVRVDAVLSVRVDAVLSVRVDAVLSVSMFLAVVAVRSAKFCWRMKFACVKMSLALPVCLCYYPGQSPYQLTREFS